MLGKFEWEVLEFMPPDEFARWTAFLKLEGEAKKRDAQKNQGKPRVMPKGARKKGKR